MISVLFETLEIIVQHATFQNAINLKVVLDVGK